MKILFINPPRWNELVGKNPSIIEKQRGFNPPLGLLYLVSSMKKNTDYMIDVLDTQPLKLTYPQLEHYLRDKDYDIVGITAMTFTLVDVYSTVKIVKKILPKAKILIGGPHTHLFPEETINLAGVDYVLMGEAEYSMIQYAKHIDDINSYKYIDGLIYRDRDNKIIKNNFLPLGDLDNIPFPDRKLLNIKHYTSLLGRGNLATTIISSRGCPYKCAFCDRPMSPITSHCRFRSAHNVADELCECVELGIKDILFYDDTFTVNKKRVMELCEEIIKRNIKIRWDIRTRVDTVDKEMLSILKKAGCAAIHYGVEAGNNRMLNVIKKGFTIEQVRETFQLTKKIGIETLAYFMIGLPEETLRDVQSTFDLAMELKPDYTHVTIFTPYPNTEFYALGLSKGIIKKDVWKEFAENPNEGFKFPLWEENFTRDELYRLIISFYKHFYLRSSYIVSRMMKIKSKAELIRKAKAGLSILFMKKDNLDKLK